MDRTEQRGEKRENRRWSGDHYHIYSSKMGLFTCKFLEFADPDYQNSNFVLTTIESNQIVADVVDFGAYKLLHSSKTVLEVRKQHSTAYRRDD